MEIARLIEGRKASDIITCSPDNAVGEVVGVLASRKIGALPVVEQGEVVGMFSERDVIYRMAEEGSACLEKRVGEVMTSPAITVDPHAKVDEALSLMTKRRIRHLPVVENGNMRGLVSIGDLVKSRMDEIEHDAAAMRDYIQHA